MYPEGTPPGGGYVFKAIGPSGVEQVQVVDPSTLVAIFGFKQPGNALVSVQRLDVNGVPVGPVVVDTFEIRGVMIDSPVRIFMGTVPPPPPIVT